MKSSDLINLLNAKYSNMEDKPHFQIWDDYEITIYKDMDTDEFEMMTFSAISDMSVGLRGLEIISVDKDGHIKKEKDWKEFIEEQTDNETPDFITEITTLFEDASYILSNWDVKKKERLHGGHADGRPISEFDVSQLARGIEVEFEHTDSLPNALEIAMDHLTEDQFYYFRLDIMEAKNEKDLTEIMERMREYLLELPSSELRNATLNHLMMMLENPGHILFRQLKITLNEIVDNMEANLLPLARNPYIQSGHLLDIDFSHGIAVIKESITPFNEIEATWTGKLDANEGDTVQYIFDEKIGGYRILSYTPHKTKHQFKKGNHG